MASALRYYVADLSEADCKAIHAQSIVWEETGRVDDDGPLRYHANEWAVAAGLGDHNTTLWMRELISEVWRRYAATELWP